MKKAILFIAFIALLLLSGCPQQPAPAQEATPTPEATAEPGGTPSQEAGKVRGIGIVPLYEMEPFAAPSEARENICPFVESADSLDAEEKNSLSGLCSEKFDGLKSENKDAISEFYDSFISLQESGLSDTAEYLADELLFSSIPADPEVFPFEGGLGTAYSDFKKECENLAQKIFSECPAAGYNSFVYWVDYSLRKDNESIYLDSRRVSGGPCRWAESAKAEGIRIKSEALTKKRVIGENSLEMRCSVYCNSNKCPVHEENEKQRKQCDNPVYYFIDSDKKEDQERIDFVDGIIEMECRVRGKKYSAQNGVLDVEKTGNCEIIPGSCDFIEADYGELGKKWIRSCCCSCERPPRETVAWAGSVFREMERRETIDREFALNLPPAIRVQPSHEITVREGELVEIVAQAYSQNYGKVSLEFKDAAGKEKWAVSNGDSAWFSDESKPWLSIKWLTGEGDAGTYEVEFIAAEGEKTTTEKVTIIVEPLQGQPSASPLPGTEPVQEQTQEPTPGAQGLSVSNPSAYFSCDGEFKYVEIGGYLQGSDAGLVEDVKVFVEGQEIFSEYSPLENYSFVALEYYWEERDYSYSVVAELSDGSSETVMEGVTENRCGEG